MSVDEETKDCRRCGMTKPVAEFAWKRRARGQRNSYCRACQKQLGRDHYLANRAVYIERARRAKRQVRLERTRLLLAYFADNPCADCGERDPVVLEFDHLGDKHFNVGAVVAERPWEQVLDEIAKCDVVCANCHRRRTARRRPTVRLLLWQGLEAGDQTRTGSKTLEGSCATDTPRPQNPGV